MNDQETVDQIRQRKADYQYCFGSPSGQRVMIDLVGFCRGAETCIAAEKGMPIDLNRTLVLEGRREVFLRIQQCLNLTPEELFSMLNGRAPRLKEAFDD